MLPLPLSEAHVTPPPFEAHLSTDCSSGPVCCAAPHLRESSSLEGEELAPPGVRRDRDRQDFFFLRHRSWLGMAGWHRSWLGMAG